MNRYLSTAINLKVLLRAHFLPRLCGLWLILPWPSPAAEITRIPPGSDIPSAIRLTRGDLLHTGLLTGSEVADIATQLETIARAHNAELSDVVRLNLNVAEDDAAFLANARQAVLDSWEKGACPVITIIPSRLPDPNSRIAADTVIALSSSSDAVAPVTGGVILPANRDALFLSGRAASGELAEATTSTMTQLFEVLAHLGATPTDIVQVKAFLQPISEWETVARAIDEIFGDNPIPPVVSVEWSSESRTTEIELIAAAPSAEDTNETISYFNPPGDKASPVFSRVARLHADEIIYIGGLTGTDASTPENEVTSLYTGLERIAIAAGSSLLHLAKATYYVTSDDNGISTAFNNLRPEFYDPDRPPAASKIALPSIGVEGRHLLIDMTAAPK